MSGEFYYPEIMPPGVALFDYDNDGDLDVFVVQDQMLGGKPLSAAKPQPAGALNSHLFRNDLKVAADGTRTLHFTDVTAASGIVTHGYAMGVATADFNNDGCVDLYVTELGPNQLFRNNCDGTFTDVSKQSGTGDAGWSISATFFDYDRDGYPDLFVGNYVDYSVATNRQCFSLQGSLDYCPPHVYRAAPSHLYHNNRDGTFTDVTAKAGMAREFGPALGCGRRGFQRRRLARPLCLERRTAESAVDQPAQRHVQEHGAPRGRRAQLSRRRQVEHGHRRRRLRQ